MLFSSITFLYLYLPILLLIYYITPTKYKNYILLVFSIIFYGFETPKFIIMMGVCITLTYINGLLIEKWRNKIHYKFSIVLSLLPLIFFKYTNFFIENTNTLFNTDIKLLKIILPLGISFYTFQMLTYLVDVWRKDMKAEKNFFNLALYVSFFPQLIAGPIVKYSQVKEQIEHRTQTFYKFNEGIFIFVCGLGKKVLIANQLGELCNLYNPTNTTILFTWLYGISYCLQVYFDFSGYSTMAIGIGKMFGFELPINFNYPFICSSIKDFWRRWHITLSSFFKEYVYIPMGGNRVKTSKYIFNMFIVWFLTGFWHGAAWNFIAWGLLFFVILMIENFIFKDKLNSVFQRILSLFILIVSFILFGSSNIEIALVTIKNLFKGTIYNNQSLYVLRNYFTIILIGIIGSTPLFKNFYEKYIKDTNKAIFIEPIFIICILMLSTAYLVDGSFNPFLYFRF